MADQTDIFAGHHFIVVRSSEMNDEHANSIIEQIELHGGKATLDNYPEESLNLEGVQYIISTTHDFPDYYNALDLYRHVVKPGWITASIANNRLAATRRYSPDPKLFMSEVVATCADLPEGDKEAVAGGILAMGGNHSAKLTTQVTHIVALSMDSDKVEQAIKNDLDIQIVLPHWFDDCLRLGKRIDEKPYTLPDPEIMQPAGDKPPLAKTNKHVAGATSPDPSNEGYPITEGRNTTVKVFKNKRILLDQDLEISPPLRKVLNGIISASKGKVVERVSDANTLVCKYRDGTNYKTASSKKMDVGNLAWLYHLVVHDIWTSPFQRLLHYPVSKEPLQGFENLKISLSNYTGEARTYLENLIIATGAECTKTLKQENTHLVTAHTQSEKVAAARDWNINVVNHLWIEESYAKWEMQSVTNPRYSHFPKKTNLGEVVGQTSIDRKVVEKVFLGMDQGETAATPHSRRKIQNDATALETTTPGKANARPAQHGTDAEVKGAQTPAPSRVGVIGKENVTPATGGSRASKAAAAAKLHGMSSDIALYEKERKRAGGVVYGGRRKADEDRVETPRKRSAEPETAADDQKSIKRQRTGSAPVEIRLLITGFKGWVGKAKKEDDDKAKLRELGIIVTEDPSKASHVAVPNILRTLKFLVAISYAPKILSTAFIEACLEQDKLQEPDDYLLEDKDYEKKNRFKLSVALDNAKANQNQLLKDVQFYCVEKIQGGFETMQSIAEANGATLTSYRGRHMNIPSRRASSEEVEEDSPENEVYLISSESAEDARLWPKFIKTAESSRRVPRIVRSEWLLSSALRQEIQPLAPHELKSAS